MKFQVSAALIGLAATAVSAQDYIQEGPFGLSIKGTNAGSTIDGYASSCHTGAGISGFCYGVGEAPPPANSIEYYFNYTGNNAVGDYQVGTLVWNQPYTGEDGPALASQGMGLTYLVNSNVAAPMFGYSQTDFLVGFDSEGELFGYAYINDANFVSGQFPSGTDAYNPTALYQWAVCYQYFTGYYYQSVAWIQAGAPHNPTCEPVTITKV
ncbi:hypothetical protein F4777DRAFT_314390 [Nemania sp. FL0916]|nr:hypothetical protein F4777DRAFT_314390 [Nemania sp. FL0916]